LCFTDFSFIDDRGLGFWFFMIFVIALYKVLGKDK